MSQFRRDRRRERYSRNLEGWNAQGFFSPAGAPNEDYATQTTVQDFVYAAASLEGLIGLYDDTGALVTALPAAGDKFSILQKNSAAGTKRSTELISGNYSVAKTNYLAPVKQKTLVGGDGASGDLNISIIGGLQEFVLSVREQTPANQPFPVQEGRAVVRGGTPTDYAIATAIAADINDSYDFERNADVKFAAVSVTVDIAGTTNIIGVNYILTDGSNQVFVGGSDVTTENVAGDFLILVKVAKPNHIYKVISSSYDGTNTTVVLDRDYSTDTQGGFDTIVIASTSNAAAAAVDAGVIGFDVTGKDEMVHFDVNVGEDLGDSTITADTNWVQGSGAGFQVASIEDECIVFDGFTTGNTAWERDYGKPDLYVDDSGTDQYVLYVIESLNQIIPSAGTPQNQTLMNSNIVIAAIVGSSLETNLDTIFAT